eukprot:scaffold39088_cov229-Amphora_coffeaeformis.AAC.2
MEHKDRGIMDKNEQIRINVEKFNAEVLSSLGKGPASFGPALPAWVEKGRLTEDEKVALTKIQATIGSIRVKHKFTERQVRAIAAFKNFNVDKTIRMLRRIDARQLSVTAGELKVQLETLTLFPLPHGIAAKRNNVNDFFYMRPSRYFPSTTTPDTIITNLIYVMDSLHERQRDRNSKIGFIANMEGWKMENFAIDYCKQFMFTLQGMKAPIRVDLFLIVNPPGWFDRVWSIMKSMLASGFRKKVHMISESRLGEFLRPGFEDYLPDELAVGKASVPKLVTDFVEFREYYEHKTGERSSNSEQTALLAPPKRVLRKQERDRKRWGESDSSSVVSGTSSAGDSLDQVSLDWSNSEGESSHGPSTHISNAESVARGTEHFGPCVPPRALEDAVRRLSPERSGTFFAIRSKMDSLNVTYPFSDWQILRVASSHNFDVDKTVNTLKRIDARQLNITAEELRPQLSTMCLFPLPNGISAKANGVHDMFYMRPSRYFPKQTTTKAIITNLIYVMDTIFERYRDPCRKIGFIANMDDWTMENFSISYCKQFMYALQGKIAPSKVDLFLIVNPPGWFDRIWSIMKPMLASGFRRKVHMIPQSRLHEFLNVGFQKHLPNEFKGVGEASVPAMIKDFVTFRKHHENRTGARMPRAEQTALMTPPKRVLRKLAREQKRQMMDDEKIHSSHSVDHIHVTSRSDVSSHVSFDSAEDEDYMEDLLKEELEDGFDEEDDFVKEDGEEDVNKMQAQESTSVGV